MIPFDYCPVCGGELEDQQVEKLLRGGRHTAVIRVDAAVCLRCGNELYDGQTLQQFDVIRGKLERQETGDFRPLGQSFEVA